MTAQTAEIQTTAVEATVIRMTPEAAHRIVMRNIVLDLTLDNAGEVDPNEGVPPAFAMVDPRGIN